MKKILFISLASLLPCGGAQAADYICPSTISCNVSGYPPINPIISCSLPNGWKVSSILVSNNFNAQGNFEFSFTNAQSMYNSGICNYVYSSGNQYYSISTQASQYIANKDQGEWQSSSNGYYCFAADLTYIGQHDPMSCPFIPPSSIN